MAKKESWYAVELKNGSKSIVNSWEVCQKIIKTCSSNARYKKFSTMKEAEKFLGKKIVEETKSDKDVLLITNKAIAFVDGSFNSDTGTWGYGVVLFPEGQENKAREFIGNGREYNSARNVAGEIAGAVKAVEVAVFSGFDEIQIHYDYYGIAAWVNNEWQPKQELTKEYKRIMEVLAEKIKISFNKVAAHSGVKFNERADHLAKMAAGIK